MRRFSLFLLLLALSAICVAQNADLSFLRQKCPKLTDMYEEELGKYHSQYIFAIDVSGTMNSYKDAVQPALAEFFRALPDGDKVTVLPFGTVTADLMDLSGTIDAGVRQSLVANIGRLYDNPNYEQGMKRCTDIEKACDMISKKINLSTDFKNNVVIILTDFRNDDGTERRLAEEQLKRMDNDFASATQGLYTRVVALDLATAADKQKPGYCLDQLKEKVFYATANGLEIVSLSNPGPQIQQWFTELKREIMVEKMRAIIDHENRMSPVELATKVDIDGNVEARITWRPSKLYPVMRIGKTTVGDESFVFVDDTTLWKNTTDTLLELELGQIRNKSMGFHLLNDSQNLCIELPTEYDEELQWLKVSKPLPETSSKVERWIFTFVIPFWLTLVICVLILIYLLLVIKAMGRNGKEQFKGTVYVTDRRKRGREVLSQDNLKPKPSVKCLRIGESGNNGCEVNGAGWTIKVVKRTPSPLLVWKRPSFEWSKEQGLVCDGNDKKRGLLGRYGKRGTRKMVSLSCTPDDAECPTHDVEIRLK